MKKIFIAIPLILGSFTFAFAQDAQELMKSVSAKYKALATSKAGFTFTSENKGKAPQTQSGTIYLKGEKYRLEMSGQEIMCDGKTSWTFIKESNEVQISIPTPNKDDISPNNIFTMYDKGFSYKFADDKVEEGKAVIELMPTDKNKSFFKIKVTINKADKQIVESKVFDKSGSKTTFVIKSFQANTPLGDDLFSFNKAKFPGVEIVDLR